MRVPPFPEALLLVQADAEDRGVLTKKGNFSLASVLLSLLLLLTTGSTARTRP